MNIRSSLLVIASAILITASPITLAQAYFTQFGDYVLLPNGKARVGDIEFSVSPTVKVFREDGKPTTLQQVKNGDRVEVSVIKINKRLLVDTIYIDNIPLGDPEITGE